MKATVRVELDKDAMSGRLGYVTGVRPGHRIAGRGNETFMGALYFRNQEWLRPGESCEADGWFVIYSKDEALFVPGFRWEICEAEKFIGVAELVEVKSIEAMDRADT